MLLNTERADADISWIQQVHKVLAVEQYCLGTECVQVLPAAIHIHTYANARKARRAGVMCFCERRRLQHAFGLRSDHVKADQGGGVGPS